MNFKPSASEALHFRQTCAISDKRWRYYAPAYVITNEPLKQEMTFIPEKCNNALTVAASGDHPFFCRLYGAKHVTTFDITCNAKIITDIKIAALHQLDIPDYWQLIRMLHTAREPLSVPNMDKITPWLSDDINKYLRDMPTHRFSMFSSGYNIDSYLKNNLQPSDFSKLRALVQQPFDFIWSDAMDLQLTDSYDFIHLSNISDYLSYADMGYVLGNMIQHTNVGGRILAQQQNNKNAELLITQVPQQLPNWEILSHGRINVLQRVR